MMDRRFRIKGQRSFFAAGKTSVETRDSNGDPVRVSFDLHAPPGSSRLCLHCPEEREPSWWDFVVASHRDTVLFRIEVDFDGLWVNHDHAMDYFIYRAPSSSSSAKLTLLSRCFSTEAEADAEDESSWRREWRMVHSDSIGLLADEDEMQLLVAELHIEGAINTAPLEAKLFRLSWSPEAVNGVGQWELTHARSSVSSVSFLDVIGWVTHSVIPFSSYLCWADYNRGVPFCDVRHPTPELRYLRLPVDDMPREDYPKYSRSVCITDNGDTMMYVKVVKKCSICPNCNPGSGFTISLWTMEVKGDENQWVPDVQITCNDLWGMKGYDHGVSPVLCRNSLL